MYDIEVLDYDKVNRKQIFVWELSIWYKDGQPIENTHHGKAKFDMNSCSQDM